MITIINKIIEHKLFKPVAISIVLSFVLFRLFLFLENLAFDYSEKSDKQSASSLIKINLTDKNLHFDKAQDLEYIIGKGDTLLKVLLDIGVDEADIFTILSATKKVFSPTEILVGAKINIIFKTKIDYDVKNLESQLSRKAIVEKVIIHNSVEEQVETERQKDGSYLAKIVKIKLTKHLAKYSGIIKNGLFVDGIAAGASPNSVMNMIGLYGYDVDFQRDIRSGDKFEILVESFYDEKGKKVKDGNVLFSSLTLSNRSINIYMHKIGNNIEYFDEKGQSVKKSLLRTPVNGARISSGFGLRRHPILGYSKMHKGTDFAAPKGTPILAAGNGTIVYRGVKGGYGNYVQIKHNSEYATAYGHASRFGKFRLGAKVKQGDVVAYVGSTGRSTGPHLHFEVLYHGKQINPAKVKATSGIKLSGKELARFKISKEEIDRERKNTSSSLRS